AGRRAGGGVMETKEYPSNLRHTQGVLEMQNKNSEAQLLKLADSFNREAKSKGHEMTQTPTPKRMREYQGRMIDSRRAERAEKVCLALSAMSTHPAPVDSTRLTKALVLKAVSCEMKSNGYYDIYETDEFRATDP